MVSWSNLVIRSPAMVAGLLIVAVCVAALVTVVPAFPVNVPYSFSSTRFVNSTPETTESSTTDDSPLISYEYFCSAFPFLSPEVQSAFISEGLTCATDSQGNLIVPYQWPELANSSPGVQSIIAWGKSVSVGVLQATVTTTALLPPVTLPHVEVVSATSTVKETLFRVATVPSLIILAVVLAGVAVCLVLQRRRKHSS